MDSNQKESYCNTSATSQVTRKSRVQQKSSRFMYKFLLAFLPHFQTHCPLKNYSKWLHQSCDSGGVAIGLYALILWLWYHVHYNKHTPWPARGPEKIIWTSFHTITTSKTSKTYKYFRRGAAEQKLAQNFVCSPFYQREALTYRVPRY